MRKRLLCFVMILSVILNLMMLPIFAEESKEELKCSCKVACKDTEGGKSESCDLCKSNIKNCAVIEKDGFLFNKSSGTITGVKNKDNVKGEVIIPDYIDNTLVTSIGEYAFRDCTGLISITIPSSVETIGEYAFWYCENLTSITIPSGVRSISEGAFAGCIGVIEFKVEEGNKFYVSEDGVIFNKERSKLLLFPSGKGCNDYNVPDKVKEIGSHAFWDCRNLTSVTISNGVTTIGDYAFIYCENLESINIFSDVITIGDSAFAYCENLEGIIIPSSVTTIGDSAFAYCGNLKSITIPSNVTTIGDYAFMGCEGLKKTYYFGSKLEWEKVKKGKYNEDLTENIKYIDFSLFNL